METLHAYFFALIRFLLTKEMGEWSVSTRVSLQSILLLSVVRSAIVKICVIRISWLVMLLICLDCALNFFTLYVELCKLFHVIDKLMTNLDPFFGFLKSILMPMNLRQDRTVLHFKFAKNLKLAHPIWNTLFLQTELVHGQVFQCLLNALSTLLKHLHFLITESHIVE